MKEVLDKAGLTVEQLMAKMTMFNAYDPAQIKGPVAAQGVSQE